MLIDKEANDHQNCDTDDGQTSYEDPLARHGETRLILLCGSSKILNLLHNLRIIGACWCTCVLGHRRVGDVKCYNSCVLVRLNLSIL